MHALRQSPGVTQIGPNCWQAVVNVDNKARVLGTFPHQADAIRARQTALSQLSTVRRIDQPGECAKITLRREPFDIPPARPEPTHAARYGVIDNRDANIRTTMWINRRETQTAKSRAISTYSAGRIIG